MTTTRHLATAIAAMLISIAPAIAQPVSSDAALAQAQAGFIDESPSSLLSPAKAFSPHIYRAGKNLVIDFRIADGYYLYRDRMSFDSSAPGKLADAQFPVGEVKSDQFFGKQVIYHHAALVKLPLDGTSAGSFKITVHYQGCAAVGVCYPPQARDVQVHGDMVVVSDPQNPGSAVAQTQSIAPPEASNCSPLEHAGRC
jgi:thioredoxin:protein disulfide reductase